jgi:tetratricopeptide (TPR) repeat protein
MATGGSDVSGPDLIKPLSPRPGTGKAVPSPDPLTRREAALAAKHGAALLACDQIFHRFQAGEDGAVLRAELAVWHDRVAELDRRRADVTRDMAEHFRTCQRLSDLLAEAATSTGQTGLGRFAAAAAAVHTGDFGPAEVILAACADRNTAPADEAARLAFGRGLIAEEDMRWTDAVDHFATAARLDPDLDHLRKARAASCRTGDLTAAFRLGKGLMVLAETSGTAVDRAMALQEHALTLEAQDRWAEAEGCLRKAIQAGRALGGPPQAGQAAALAALSRVLEAQGRSAEADPPIRKALEVSRQSIGEAHPAFVLRLLALARLVAAEGREAEAEPILQKALDIAGRPGGGHPVALACLTALAELAEAQGQLPRAESLHRQALEAGARAVGPTHPDHAGRLCALAEVVRAARRLPEAETLFRQALEIDRATIGPDHRDYGVALNNLAGVVEAQGRPAEAEPLYATAVAIFRDQLGDLHPATQKVAGNFRALLASQLPISPHRAGIEMLWQAGRPAGKR